MLFDVADLPADVSAAALSDNRDMFIMESFDHAHPCAASNCRQWALWPLIFLSGLIQGPGADPGRDVPRPCALDPVRDSFHAAVVGFSVNVELAYIGSASTYCCCCKRCTRKTPRR